MTDNSNGITASRELELEAAVEKLPELQSALEELLEEAGCPLKTQMQIGVAVEEVFVNIAHYAYAQEGGKAAVRLEIREEPRSAAITFADSGRPYDPLGREDPDITLPAEDRQIGGLGIFMTKKLMDSVEYEFRAGQNILTIRKRF